MPQKSIFSTYLRKFRVFSEKHLNKKCSGSYFLQKRSNSFSNRMCYSVENVHFACTRPHARLYLRVLSEVKTAVEKSELHPRNTREGAHTTSRAMYLKSHPLPRWKMREEGWKWQKSGFLRASRWFLFIPGLRTALLWLPVPKIREQEERKRSQKLRTQGKS